MRGDARDDFGKRPRLAGIGRQFGVSQILAEGHRRSFAAAGAEEQDRHYRHYRQHDEGDDQGHTALRLVLHLAA